MTYAKYEFTELPEILTAEEGIENASVVIVGKLVETEGVYDEEGNVITAPVISDKIAVDIIYNKLPELSLEPFRVTPETPKSFIGGQEQLYRDSIKQMELFNAVQGTVAKTIEPGHLRYFTPTRIIDQIGYNFSEPDFSEIPTFREWKISNDPVETGVERKVLLAELTVTKDEIRLTTLVRHFDADGTRANTADRLVQRIATNDVKEYDVNGTLVGEREYWDHLTGQGMTPYQLLDARMPELDAAGLFNNY